MASLNGSEDGSEVDGINGSCSIGVAGIIITEGLDIGAKFKLAMLVIVVVLLGKDGVGAEMRRDAILGWECTDLLCGM